MASDLTILLLAQFALYGLGWLLLGTLLRELRVPAWLWAAYSVMQAAGMFIAAARSRSIEITTCVVSNDSEFWTMMNRPVSCACFWIWLATS